jgi:hypothetical protein
MTKGETQSKLGKSCEDDDEDPLFWHDICTDIGIDSSDYINLQLNPEVCNYLL